MELYTVTKIFGVDAVKTRVFRRKEDARGYPRAFVSLLILLPSRSY